MPETKHNRYERISRYWYKFSRNKLSVVGLVVVSLIVLLAVFAPVIVPYPEHAGAFVDFDNAYLAPSSTYILGTDNIGRDIFSRIVFAFRPALITAAFVLGLSVPFGVGIGLIAGYYQGTIIDTLLMRTTDIFLSVPPLVLALAVASVLEPNLMNAMLAITIFWWSWYARMVYGMVCSFRNEYFVRAAELTGAGFFHIVVRELLPNCMSTILTKMTLDIGFVVMMSASLSFVGLGEQPPKPALGTMVSNGTSYMPTQWWMVLFPALAILVIVLGFNLLGDGIRDMLSTEET